MKQGSQNPIAQSQWEADLLPSKWHLERGSQQTRGNYKQRSSWDEEVGLLQGQGPSPSFRSRAAGQTPSPHLWLNTQILTDILKKGKRQNQASILEKRWLKDNNG